MKFDCGNGSLWLGDCLDLMKHVPDGLVDMVLCDLPYGTTACGWDTIIPFEPLWKQYWRVCKSNAAIVLTASQPFSSALVMSQINNFQCEWIWNKNIGSNFAQTKTQPMKEHENIFVFRREKTKYNPIFEERSEGGKQNIGRSNLRGTTSKDHFKNMVELKRKQASELRVPRSVQKFNVHPKHLGYDHPTQKPVALFEYLIKTYTNSGDFVLDNCSGSGTTAVAAQQCGRRWLCIEKELEYYLRSAGRIHAAVNA